MFPAYYVFNFLLTTLLILHLFWGYFIIKVAYKVGRVKPCHKLKTFPGDVGGRYSDRHQESVRKLQWLVLTGSWDVYLLLFMINKFLRDLRRPFGKYRNACSGVLWSQKIARLQISALKNSINTYYMKWKCQIVHCFVNITMLAMQNCRYGIVVNLIKARPSVPQRVPSNATSSDQHKLLRESSRAGSKVWRHLIVCDKMYNMSPKYWWDSVARTHHRINVCQ